MAKFPELMNVIAQLKNETIKLTKEISSNDDQVINMVNNSIDGLECSLDVCNNALGDKHRGASKRICGKEF